MQIKNKLLNQHFIPVILGSNIGAYSTARSFHEAYGIKSICICRELIGAMKNSAILKPIVETKMEEKENMLVCLNKIEQNYPKTPKILIGSADWHVEMLVNINDKLGDEWVIPYPKQDILHRITNKSKFYNICEELGVDYPKFISFEGESADHLQLPFDFPVVIKPANTVSYQSAHFLGKKKVYIINNKQELEYTISIIRDAKYTDKLIIQEFVPGDDTSMHILTLYTAQDGETKLASFGQTLLEDHTPSGIGNPLVIRTFRNDEVVEQAKRIVEHIGWVGFSNFDLKYDVRDEKYKFFELNPRLGRSNYYVTAEGHNTTEYYVKDYLYNEPMSFSIAENEILYSIIPKRLLLKNIKQNRLRDRVKKLIKCRLIKNPMFYLQVERSLRRLFSVILSTFNFYRKFNRYPPL